jgi:hypothetical protein
MIVKECVKIAREKMAILAFFGENSLTRKKEGGRISACILPPTR